MKYADVFKIELERIEQSLENYLPSEAQEPVQLHEAMRYAVLGGGKRFRPVLCLSACEAAGGHEADAVIPGVALELIHSYSLVHDDLPALDNDDTRRGKPAVHRKYGEAMAILAGDGLLTLALELLGRYPDKERVADFLTEISRAAGTAGMIGGQVVDLTCDRDRADQAMLDYISIHKTGQLIRASAVCGALAAGAGEETRQRIQRYGEMVGLSFQLIDDMRDGDGYMRSMKPADIKRKVRELLAKAGHELRPFGQRAAKLRALTDFLWARVPGEMMKHA